MKKGKSNILIKLLFLFIVLIFNTTTFAARNVKLNTQNKTVYVGDSYTIKLLNNNKTVKWSVSNKNVKIIKRSKKSLKIRALKKGSTVVKAKVGKKIYKCKIKIKENEVENTEDEKTEEEKKIIEEEIVEVIYIDVDKTNYTMFVGDERNIVYSIFPDDATNKNVSFVSSDANVASVDSYGRVKAVSKGKCIITVKCGNCSDTLNVNVYENVGKREKPISAYKETIVELYDYDEKIGDFKIQLLDYLNGDNVPQSILKDEFNDQPTSSQEYVYLIFEIEYLRGEKEVSTMEVINYLSNFFNAQSNVKLEPKGYAYNTDDLDLSYNTILYPGGSVKCSQAFIYEKKDLPLTYRIETGYDYENSDYVYTWFTTVK